MYRKLRLSALGVLYEIPLMRRWAYKRLPRHRSGYKKHWVGEFGKQQRMTLRERQERSPQIKYPTVEELSRAVAQYAPERVLDIGCGYGRFLIPLSESFNVEGCDIAPDLLAEVPEGYHVFELDLANPPPGWVTAHGSRWDVSYAWAVFMYFIDDREHMRAAMQVAETITAKKVLVWDWKHVCDYMRETYPSDMFEYHYIPLVTD